MRRLITLITLTLALSAVQAQDRLPYTHNAEDGQKHMKFMGMNMGGKLATFVNKLRQKGFTADNRNSTPTSTVMTGKFAGYNNCTLMIYPNSEGNVYLVGVIFPENDTWMGLHTNYSTIKNMLIQKYGEPIDCKEEFDTDYPPRDDFDRMHQTRMERCKYSTIFALDEGRIVETISTTSMNCYVMLLYGDEEGYNINKENAIDDL